MGTRRETPAERTIASVARIEELAYQARSRVDHIAGAIIRGAGSGAALLVHALWFVLWALANSGELTSIRPFDPFPFHLLTTIVALEAILLTLFVLIAQNRMAREADKRAQLDLQVNLLAEKEATMILLMLQEIQRHLGITGTTNKDLEELLKETRLEELAEKLEGTLPSDQ